MLARLISSELGASVPIGYGGPVFSEWFRDADIDDILSAVTLIRKVLVDTSTEKRVASWVEGVERIFREENLAYEADPAGGVHPTIDSEFARNREASISALRPARYRSALDAVEASFSRLATHPFDSKAALRDMFEAAETIYKLAADTGAPLTQGTVKSELEPVVQRAYANEKHACMAGARMASSFADWVQAVHPYRHGQGTEEIVVPPDEITVLVVSQGASFVRWLAEIDRAEHS